MTAKFSPDLSPVDHLAEESNRRAGPKDGRRFRRTSWASTDLLPVQDGDHTVRGLAADYRVVARG